MKIFNIAIPKKSEFTSKSQVYKNFNLIFFIFFMVFSVIRIDYCYAQITMQRSIGTTTSDGASSIRQTSDSGYIMTGSTFAPGSGSNGEIYTMKLDAGGNLLWRKYNGGAGIDYGSSIIQSSDGEILLSGYTSSHSSGQTDIYLQKMNSIGVPLWEKLIGSTGSEYSYSSIQTNDGGYALAGYSSSFGAGGLDFYIVKTDSGGAVEWSKTAGGTGTDQAYSIIQASDSSYLIAGATNSFGEGLTDLYIVKLDKNGNLLWSRTFGGQGSEETRAVIQSQDGGFVLAGFTNSYGAGDYDSYFVKFSAAGTLQWSRTAGGADDDRAFSILLTSDSGFISAGYTGSFGAGFYDVNIIKLSSSGIIQWCKTIGGPANDVAASIIRTRDGGYAIAGTTNSFGAGFSDVYFMKIESNGNTCGNFSAYSPTSGTGGISAAPVTIFSPQTPAVTGYTMFEGSGGIMTSLCLTGVQPLITEEPRSFELSQNYPNPFNPVTKIRFTLPESSLAELIIYDVNGRESETLINEQLNAGTYETEFRGMNLASGIYFCKLTAGSYSKVIKMLLVK